MDHSNFNVHLLAGHVHVLLETTKHFNSMTAYCEGLDALSGRNIIYSH